MSQNSAPISQPRYILDGKLRSNINYDPEKSPTVLTSVKKKEKSTNSVGSKLSDSQAAYLTKRLRKMLEQYISVIEDIGNLYTTYSCEYLSSVQQQIDKDQRMIQSPFDLLFSQKSKYLSKDWLKFDKNELPEKVLLEILELHEKYIHDGLIKTEDEMDKFLLNVMDLNFRRIHLKTEMQKNCEKPVFMTMDAMNKHWAVVQANKRIVKINENSKDTITSIPTFGQKLSTASCKTKHPGPIPFPALYCMRKKPKEKIKNTNKQETYLAKMQLLRSKCKQKLEQMCQLAKSNQLVTDRLMSKHSSITTFNEERSNHISTDILELFPQPHPKKPEPIAIFINEAGVGAETEEQPSPPNTLPLLSTVCGTASTQVPTVSNLTRCTSQTDVLIPLDVNQLAETHRSMIANVRSALWCNYSRSWDGRDNKADHLRL